MKTGKANPKADLTEATKTLQISAKEAYKGRAFEQEERKKILKEELSYVDGQMKVKRYEVYEEPDYKKLQRHILDQISMDSKYI